MPTEDFAEKQLDWISLENRDFSILVFDEGDWNFELLPFNELSPPHVFYEFKLLVNPMFYFSLIPMFE
jgi:hypothetical protein